MRAFWIAQNIWNEKSSSGKGQHFRPNQIRSPNNNILVQASGVGFHCIKPEPTYDKKTGPEKADRIGENMNHCKFNGCLFDVTLPYFYSYNYDKICMLVYFVHVHIH